MGTAATSCLGSDRYKPEPRDGLTDEFFARRMSPHRPALPRGICDRGIA
jgi:hypothetical protein